MGITRAKKELYISNSVSRMLYGRTQRNEPSRFLREIEPEYIEETRSPVLEQRSRFGGWGDSYRDTVPGGASGYSGPSGWGRSASGYGSGGYGSGYSNRSGYLNREYNAGEGRGFGSAYANRGRARADTVPAMAAAAQVRDMALVTVLHILTERRRKNLQSKSPLQAHRQQKPLQKAQNTMSRAILWSTRCSDAVR